MPIPIPQRIKRYTAWLERKNTDRPLIGLVWEPDVPPLLDFIRSLEPDQPVVPDQVDPAVYLPPLEKWYQHSQSLESDTINCFSPSFGFPWLEAIAGCPIIGRPGSLWAESCLGSMTDREPVVFDPKNPWLLKLMEFVRVVVNFSNRRFPVALPQTRGPLDILAALRTPEQMCLDLVDQPAATAKILEELTEFWISINQVLLELIPPFNNGYCSRMKAWLPGPAITPQNDVSSYISSGLYQDLVLPWDRKIIDAFPYHCFHAHGVSLHQVDNWLQLDKLSILQLTLEHTIGGPSLEKTLPVLREILAQKPLLLCPLDTESADICIRELPAAGLAVMVGSQAGTIGNNYRKWLSKNTGLAPGKSGLADKGVHIKGI